MTLKEITKLQSDYRCACELIQQYVRKIDEWETCTEGGMEVIAPLPKEKWYLEKP